MTTPTAPPPARPATTSVLGRPIDEFDVGDRVALGRAASPQFAGNPIRLQLTQLPAAARIDYSGLRDLSRARWVYLTGHELDGRGRRLDVRTVLACVAGIVSLVPR